MLIEPLNLTDDEIANICAPLKTGSAQTKYLKGLGMKVERKPNGRPLVARGEFERVFISRPPEPAAHNVGPQLDRAALLSVIRGGKRGAQTQRR